VGSGKFAFLNALLGEMVSISTTSKSKWESEAIAYCSQEAWLENGTIRHNIIGISPYERKWYDSVVLACGLQADVKQLQKGDDTRIGSKGLNLSGGQKQRVVCTHPISQHFE